MELCWITETDARPLSIDAAREAATRDDGVSWAHCDHTDAVGMTLLAELLPARATDLQTCHVRSPVPLLHAYEDHFFSAMNGLGRGSDRRLHFVTVKYSPGRRFVFTVLGPRHDALADTTAEHPSRPRSAACIAASAEVGVRAVSCDSAADADVPGRTRSRRSQPDHRSAASCGRGQTRLTAASVVLTRKVSDSSR
jgi:hypothetical protein